jgi:hypothetical protein
MSKSQSVDWRVALCWGLFAIAFLASRLYLIESDLAPFAFSGYQTIDEPFYVSAAFEWAFGRFEPPEFMAHVSSLPNGLFFNAIAYVNLLLFGNTYTGLRLNVVLLALVTSIIFSYVLYYRFSIAGLIISLPLYLLTLPWFMASLAVDPTLYRLFHLSIYLGLLCWLEIRGRESTPIAIFILSFLAYSGVLLVYVTNLFMVFATIAYYSFKAYRCRDGRLFLRFCCVSIFALLASVLLWATLTKLAFGGLGPTVTFVLNARQPRFDFVYNWQNLFDFSFFSRTPYVFYVYMAGTLLMAGRLVFRVFERDVDKRPGASIDDAVSLLSLAFFAQTLFINDYPTKKLVFLSPFIIFAALLLFRQVDRFLKVPIVITSTVFVLYWVIPSATQAYDVLFRNYTENMKSSMIGLRFLDGVKVCGWYSHGFRLYNNIKPCLMTYVHDYVFNDLPRFNAIMSGKYPEFAPEYAIGPLFNATFRKMWMDFGFDCEKILISDKVRFEGPIVLFKRHRSEQQTSSLDCAR